MRVCGASRGKVCLRDYVCLSTNEKCKHKALYILVDGSLQAARLYATFST